ncbi:hypothetical protein ACFFF0_12765 [Deinococcus budaensis]|uniref:hypothetical protein n=1 Tax=Deinococcus budaensis TaxID=1665626 RepID=UPI0031B6317E
MLIHRFPLARLGTTLLLSALAASTAAAQSTPSLKLPANYLSRFGSTELVVSTESGYGVRYFPLMFDQDIRISLVKAPTYWDYNISTRTNDTTLAAGVFYNKPRLEITRDPSKGVQYSGLLQGRGAYSKVSGGYAFTVSKDRVRVLNNVGVAITPTVAAPYTQSEVSGGYGKSFGKLNTYVGSTARLYTFPVQKQLQGSFDAVAVANISPVKGLTLDASHFERFVGGQVAVPDFGLGRYQESNVGVTYRLPGAGAASGFGVGAVRSRLTHTWQNDYTYLRGDLLLNVGFIPSLFGPSVGYQWSPTGKDNKWLISLVTLPK